MNKAVDSQSEAYIHPHIVWRRAKLGADQTKATERVEVNILQRKDTAVWEPQQQFLFFAFIFKLLFDFYWKKSFPLSHPLLSLLFQSKRESNLGEEAQERKVQELKQQ